MRRDCVVLAAHGPQHLAEVGGDFRIGFYAVGGFERLERFRQLALAEQHPAHAVHDEGVLRRQCERLGDQFVRFGEADVALGQRVAEGVQRVRMIRFQLEQVAEVFLENLRLALAFGGQRRFVEQFRIVGLFGERRLEQRVGFVAASGFTQQLRFGQDQLDLFSRGAAACGAQQFPGFVRACPGCRRICAARPRAAMYWSPAVTWR